MKRNETQKRIRFMGIRYALIAGFIYAGWFIVLVLFFHVLDVFLSLEPAVMLMLYLADFILSIFLTKATLSRPFLKHVIYDTGG